MESQLQLWLTKLEYAGKKMGLDHLDILIDQASWSPSLIQPVSLFTPKIEWFSLFEGTPEEGLLEQSPLLMRINLDIWQHKEWLMQLMVHFYATARLLVLISPLPFSELSNQLQQLSIAEWGGKQGLLRFYDTRIFPVLLTRILTPQQQLLFNSSVLFWSWMDRDLQPVWYSGSYYTQPQSNDDLDHSNEEPPISLDDTQFEMVCCISDAEAVIKQQEFTDNSLTKEQNFTYYYDIALKFSQTDKLGKQLEEYIRDEQLINNTKGVEGG